jgi:hypothetical protein
MAYKRGRYRMTRDEEVDLARVRYRDIWRLIYQMELDHERFPNRSHWMNATGHLREATESIARFIGDRLLQDVAAAEAEIYRERWKLQDDELTGWDDEGES